MDTDMQDLPDPRHDLYPWRKRCKVCDAPFCYIILDRQFCSYDCAGAPAPDSGGGHPASCWTWDGKPKMCFCTPALAEAMRVVMGVPGVISYYCGIHHLWHLGYALPADTMRGSTTCRPKTI